MAVSVFPIVGIMILIFSTIADAKPISEYGLTLGESRVSAESKFEDSGIELLRRLKNLSLYDKPLDDSKCGRMGLVFSDDTLIEIYCYQNVTFGDNGNAHQIFQMYDDMLSDIRKKYGKSTYSDYYINQDFSKYRYNKLNNSKDEYDGVSYMRNTWYITGEVLYVIEIEIVPLHNRKEFLFSVHYTDFKPFVKLFHGDTSKSNIYALNNEWKRVTPDRGQYEQKSKAFYLSGERTGLYCSVDGDVMSYAVIYVVPQGSTVEQSGEAPVVTITGPGAEITHFEKEPGYYYFDIRAANSAVLEIDMKEE